ncbi:MAG: hydroxyacylglutathione hydrolase, partial [Neisseria sp.]|nr:hydroxyacylglutathione hydrolase [Neisseria sp.]
MKTSVKITPIPALNDNYIWLMDNGTEAVCIDPGEAAPVLDFLRENRLNLQQIWITHHHGDHTAGIVALKQAFPECRVYGNHDIAGRTDDAGAGQILPFPAHGKAADAVFSDGTAEVWHTPGHTDTHLAYLFRHNGQTHVFCGDTLFSAGCGRVFTGTMEQLYQSLKNFSELPDDTLFYPAHEYTAPNLCFAAAVEPNNPDIQTALQAAENTPTLP